MDNMSPDAPSWGPFLVTEVHVEVTSGPSSNYVYTFKYLQEDGRRRIYHVHNWSPEVTWPDNSTGLSRDGSRFRVGCSP